MIYTHFSTNVFTWDWQCWDLCCEYTQWRTFVPQHYHCHVITCLFIFCLVCHPHSLSPLFLLISVRFLLRQLFLFNWVLYPHCLSHENGFILNVLFQTLIFSSMSINMYTFNSHLLYVGEERDRPAAGNEGLHCYRRLAKWLCHVLGRRPKGLAQIHSCTFLNYSLLKGPGLLTGTGALASHKLVFPDCVFLFLMLSYTNVI